MLRATLPLRQGEEGLILLLVAPPVGERVENLEGEVGIGRSGVWRGEVHRW